MQATLAASPGSAHFVPPICLPELAARLRASYRRQVGIGLALSSAFVLFALFLALTKRSPLSIQLFAIALFIVLGFATDSLLLLRQSRALEDRARFMSWLQGSGTGRRGALICLSFLISIGALQLTLQAACGGLEKLVLAYGADFGSIRAGQYWRYATGPLFHSGSVHFINNALFLMFIGTVSWSMLGYESLVAFAIGNVVGVFAQMAWGSATFDAFLGISPGVFALFGCVLASGWLERGRWPKGFTVLCGWLAMASLIMSQVLSSKAATVSHFAGLFTGFALILASHWVRRARREREIDELAR